MMNTLKNMKSILLIMVSFALIISCDEDDSPETETKANEIKVNDDVLEISNAIMFDDGTYDGVTEFQLYLTSSGITIDDNEDFSGSGDMISLRLFSSENTELAAGKYLYDDQDNTSLIINRGYHYFGYDSATAGKKSSNAIKVTAPSSKDEDIASGSITVTLNNGIYTINVNLKDENDDAVTGYYKGSITLKTEPVTDNPKEEVILVKEAI